MIERGHPPFVLPRVNPSVIYCIECGIMPELVEEGFANFVAVPVVFSMLRCQVGQKLETLKVFVLIEVYSCSHLPLLISSILSFGASDLYKPGTASLGRYAHS
jgi:hypothetical protein